VRHVSGCRPHDPVQMNYLKVQSPRKAGAPFAFRRVGFSSNAAVFVAPAATVRLGLHRPALGSVSQPLFRVRARCHDSPQDCSRCHPERSPARFIPRRSLAGAGRREGSAFRGTIQPFGRTERSTRCENAGISLARGFSHNVNAAKQVPLYPLKYLC
jgi:hypothetical protein